MYAAMTSGDPGAVAALHSDVDRALGDTSDEIGTIRYAEDTPDWDSPSARTRFNMRAWATRASAEVAFIRLNRAALALRAVEQSYRDMEHAASGIIDVWRRTKASATDALSLLMLRAAVLGSLDRARRAHATRVAQATEFMVDDPLTADQEEWLENGLLRSLRHDLEDPTDLGPIIPGTLATGDDDGFTPQGLGYDKDSGYLVQTSYTDGRAQLSLIDPETGTVVQTVDLGRGGPGDTPPDHAGGVAVHHGTVYVMSSDSPPRMFSYSLSDIERAGPGSTVDVLAPPREVAAGAYSTIHGNTLYVGSHDPHGPGELYTYTWDPDRRSWEDRRGPFPTPPEGQGVVVRDGTIIFSSSLGRDNGSTLTSYRLDDVLGAEGGDSLGDPLATVELPNMSEGIAALPEGLLTTFESGAEKYVDPRSASLEDLWAAMNMTVTPYSELGLGGGTIDVEPVTLTQAASLFEQVQAGLDAVERQVARMSLGGGVLGDIAEGPLFAVAATTHLDETAQWLDEGRVSAEITATGLVSAATSYEDSDADSGGLLGRLRSLIP